MSKLPPGMVHNVRAVDILPPEHLTALGKVAAEWGMLEAALNNHGTALLETRVYFGTLTRNPGGRVTAELLSEIVPSYFRDFPELQIKLLDALALVSPLADHRANLLHGMWGAIGEATGLTGPLSVLRPMATVIKGGGGKWKWIEPSVKDIEKTADDIAHARFQINEAFMLVRLHRQRIKPP
jgi:hypothetical protein